MSEAEALPVIFIAIMGLSILLYALLDGFDLGVGILLPIEPDRVKDRDIMIASIGPFWDANETWLVLAVGVLLIAFPSAHSLVLYHLYLPATLMLFGLILRGVAFDFRAKAAINYKLLWDRVFKIGSILTATTQGYMLGQYVTGFKSGWAYELFSLLSAFGVASAYTCIGSAWLVMKTEGDLQIKSTRWAQRSLRIMVLGIVAVSLVNLAINPDVYHRWFDYPLIMFVLIVPLLCFSTVIAADVLLKKYPLQNDRLNYLPFSLVTVIFILTFIGLAFSYFPYIVPDELTIWEAASAPESLKFILVGVVIVVPVIFAYTVFSYRVFRGKATQLKYY